MSSGAAAPVAAPAGRGRRFNTLPFVAPSVTILLLWMIVPLAMTLWFSVQRYNLLDPSVSGLTGLDNYEFLVTDPDFWAALVNTLVLVGSVLAITVVSGTLLAVLFDQPFPGRDVARLLAIAPFFVMPTVAALVWKNLLMHPIYGVFGAVAQVFGLRPVDWFAEYPMVSVIMIVSWEWIPFALLILLTAVQSLDREQLEAARMDGAGPISQFVFIVLPHLSRAISVVVMIETIFLLTVFAEIFVTTAGGPGNATTNLAFLIYARALLQFDVAEHRPAGSWRSCSRTWWRSFSCARSPAGSRFDDVKRNMVGRVAVAVLGWSVALLLFFPIGWMVLTSFKTETAAVVPSLAFSPSLESYAEVLSRAELPAFRVEQHRGVARGHGARARPSGPGRLRDGVPSDASHPRHAPVDAVDQDAGRRSACWFRSTSCSATSACSTRGSASSSFTR